MQNVFSHINHFQNFIDNIDKGANPNAASGGTNNDIMLKNPLGSVG